MHRFLAPAIGLLGLALTLALAAPATAETCQECLDMLDVNEGVACWKANGCDEKITSSGGASSQEEFERRWLELRQKRGGPTLQTPQGSPPAPPTPPSPPQRPADPPTPRR